MRQGHAPGTGANLLQAANEGMSQAGEQGNKGIRGGGARAGVLGAALADSASRPGASILAGLAGWAKGAGAWLTGWLVARAREEAAERRTFLWLPVLFGCGVLMYFAAETEPALWAPAAAVLGALAFAWRARRADRLAMFRAAVAVAFVFLGFLAAGLKTARVSAPVIERVMIVKITAFVEEIELRESGARLVLRPLKLEGRQGGVTPARVRVTMRWTPDFTAGAFISATMRLLPPPRPSAPGGYDFAREAYFSGIGAVGNLVSRPELAPAQAMAPGPRFVAAVDRGRNWLATRIMTIVGGSNGAVAASLVTGKRGAIPEQAKEDLRAAGVFHIVAISGLHMMLAAGLFVWLLRAGLALAPSVALNWPIKTWAALFGMAGAVAYCIFSGAHIATQRALVMTLVMLAAVVCGRPAVSMRNLAIAALIVLALEPNALLGASFQLSFAAVAAMIAVYERRAKRSPEQDVPALASSPKTPQVDDVRDARASAIGRALLGVKAIALTTIVASVATDPYGLYHFNRITPYGLIGNILVLPLVEFVVMPSALIGVLLAPFGLDAPVWWIMGQGVGWMMTAAAWVAGLPGSRILVASFGSGALLVMTLGLLWITLWRTSLRWFGIVFAMAGIALAKSAPRADMIVSGQGQIVAYRAESGRLDVLNARANRFGAVQYLTSDADSRAFDAHSLAPEHGRCDRSGCVGRLRDGRVVALALSRAALAEDCARADILITPLLAEGLCSGPERIFDRQYLERHGAARIFLEPDGALRLETIRNARFDRPWWPAPPLRQAGARAPAGGADLEAEPDIGEWSGADGT